MSMASSNRRLELVVTGIPETAPDAVGAVCRSHLVNAATNLAEATDTADFALVVGTRAAVAELAPTGLKRQHADGSGVRYVPSAPLYTFEQLIVPDDVRRELVAAVDFLNVKDQVFEGRLASRDFAGLPGFPRLWRVGVVPEVL